MSYKSDFENDAGWSAVDTNIKLNSNSGRQFREYLKENSIKTIIRYYASTRRPKTISDAEARLLSSEGFNLIPVFQDRNRLVEDFGAAKGRANARSAVEFAQYVGQPHGSTILFAADADFSNAEIDSHIAPYFEAVQDELDGAFKVGAYGSGALLQKLLDKGLIDVPWISMSRAFLGTKDFFYSNKWALRQVPPDRTHAGSGITHDRNVLKLSPAELGAFQVDEDGRGVLVGAAEEDAILGGGTHVGTGAGNAASTTGGTDAYVSTEGLNFRASPDGTVIEALTIGDLVRDLGPADVAGWRRAEVKGRSGFVFGKYLRPPATPEVEALLKATIAEWVRFEKGVAHEETDPYCGYVGEMWASIGLPYDGRSHYPNGEEIPWSAAFISFVVRRAGPAYAKFKFDQAHAKFIHDAIQSRVIGRADRPFWGYRRTEQKPAIGDIVAKQRAGLGITYDYAENHSEFKSHSDVVVEVTPQVIRVIGGNVGDTVSMRDNIQEYHLDAGGFIADGQKVIAVLKNRAHEV